MTFNPQEHMMDLKGKQYLQVMWRLVWFREEHPDWCINTELVAWDKEAQTAVFKAEIIEPHTEAALSTGYGSESIRDFKDYLEKAETKAVGRALAMLGYGTQFAPELDEGERIVDSPVPPKKPAEKKQEPKQLVNRQQRYPAKQVTAEEANNLAQELLRAGVNMELLMKQYKVNRLMDLTPEQMVDIYGKLDNHKRKQEQPDSGPGDGQARPAEGIRAAGQGA